MKPALARCALARSSTVARVNLAKEGVRSFVVVVLVVDMTVSFVSGGFLFFAGGRGLVWTLVAWLEIVGFGIWTMPGRERGKGLYMLCLGRTKEAGTKSAVCGGPIVGCRRAGSKELLFLNCPFVRDQVCVSILRDDMGGTNKQ